MLRQQRANDGSPPAAQIDKTQIVLVEAVIAAEKAAVMRQKEYKIAAEKKDSKEQAVRKYKVF